MKVLVISAIALSACASQPAHFVDRGLFNNSPIVTARARTPDEAKMLALAAIPKGFEPDQEFKAPVMSCGFPGEAPAFDEKTMLNSRCPSGTYRVDVALLPHEGAEREAILATRQQGLEELQRSDSLPTQ